MKESIKSIVCFILLLIVLSCDKDKNDTNIRRILGDATSVQSTVSAKTFVDSNEKLNVHLNLRDPEFTKELSDIEVAKLKAAVYRFYSNVGVRDNLYYTSLDRAEEINISKELFKAFKDNLDQMNRNIKEVKAQGGKVNVQQVTPEYLESLLN